MGLKEKIISWPLVETWKRIQQKKRFHGSINYWEDRYKREGNSGDGSYDHLAEFKAAVINTFIEQHHIQTVIEFGCGDGNQLLLSKYPHYIGLDVSPTAIQKCNKLFHDDPSKSFFLYHSMAHFDKAGLFRAELTLSLDVLFHLVEFDIFKNYLFHLFESAKNYVIIYASDFDQEKEPVYRHENRRNFTRFVKENFKEWELMEIVKNKYPSIEFGEKGSLSDFYIYRK